MSTFVKSCVQVGTYTSGDADALMEIEADTAADLPAANAYTGYNIYMGSVCDIIADGTRYKIDSGGTWHQVPAGVTLDLTGYYTSAQTDSAITAKVNTLDAGLYDIDPDETVQWISETNGVIAVQKQYIQIATSQVTGLDTALNGAYPLDTWQSIADGTDILTLGVGRYIKTTGLNTLINRPTGYTGGILLIVEKIANSGRRRITLFPISETFNTVSHFCILENANNLGTFGSWVRFDGGTVL